MNNFILKFTEITGLPEDQCKILISQFSECLKKSLFEDGEVTFRNFGKFVMIKKEPRKHTGLGKVVNVGPKRKIRFYPSTKMIENSDIKQLINLLNESKKTL